MHIRQRRLLAFLFLGLFVMSFWPLTAQEKTAGPEIAATLRGHTDVVYAVAISQDGKYVATGSFDNTIKLWEAATAHEVKTFGGPQGHQKMVLSVAFNNDGTMVASGSADNTLKVWDVPVTRPIRKLAGSAEVSAIALTADGSKLAAGSQDGLVKILNAADLKELLKMPGHQGPVHGVAFSANGQVLASAGADRTVRFWNAATGQLIAAVGAHGGPVNAVAVSPNNATAFSAGDDGQVKFWTIPPAAKSLPAHAAPITALFLTPDGNQVLTASKDKTVRQALTAGKEIRVLTGPAAPVTSVALSPQGNVIAAGTADHRLFFWNAADGKPLAQILAHAAAVTSVGFHPQNGTLMSAGADGLIKTWAMPPVAARSLAHPDAVLACAASADGKKLFTGSADKIVRAWDVAKLTIERQYQGHGSPLSAIAVTANGQLLASGDDNGSIRLWNQATSKETEVLQGHVGPVTALAFNPAMTQLLSTGTDGKVKLWRLPLAVPKAPGDKAAPVQFPAPLWQQAHSGPVRRAIFTPKGDQVITAGADKNVKVWNVADGKNMKTIAAHDGAVSGLAVTPDGGKLITCSADKTVRIWNLSAKPGAPEETTPAAVFSLAAPAKNLALSPGGARVAVSVTEPLGNLVRVFDLGLGKEVQVLAEHDGPVASLAFLDNRTLVAGSLDKSVRLLDVGVLTVFEAHKEGVLEAHHNGDGTQLLSAGNDQTIKIWDAAKVVPLRTFGPLAQPIKSAVYNRDFTQVGAAAGTAVKVWNVADGKEVLTLSHPAEVLSLSFSADKTKIATGSVDRNTRVFDAATGKELQFIPQEDAVSKVVFMPQNNALVSAAGKTPRLDTLALARIMAADNGPVYSLAVTPNGSHVLSAGADKVVKMWNVANGAMERSFAGAGAPLRSVAIAKNNLLVAAGGEDQTVRLYNLADAKELGSVKAGAAIRSLAFSPNSLTLAAAAGKTWQSWSVAYNAGQPLPADFLKAAQTFAAPDGILDFAVAADNATIYAGSASKAVEVWKLASPVPTRNFPHPNHVDAAAFQPRGNLLVSGCHDGKIRIFDLVKNALVKEINAHTVANATMIYTVAFTPDGKQVVSGSYDQSLKLWDVSSGNLVREFKAYKVKEFEKGHQDGVFSAAFSPDGKLLASGSGGLERIIKIWNVADGAVLRDLANPRIKASPAVSHPGWVYNLRFTRDGKHLVSVGDAPLNKGFLAVWDPADGKMLYGETMPLGTFFGLAIAPNDQFLAVGAGPRGRPTPDFNSAYLLKMPKLRE